MLSSFVFCLVLVAATYFFTKNITKIIHNIKLGKSIEVTGSSTARWKNVFLLAFGQSKMFRNIPMACLHFIIYAGFIIINIEILEIIIDGIFGTHRVFLQVLPINIYNIFINIFEFLACGVTLACIVFLIRRIIIKVPRVTHPDLKGFPQKDAIYILLTEIILMSLFLTMNATDLILNPNLGINFFISGKLSEIFIPFSPFTLEMIERTCWWLHIIGILAFLNYLPYSKHLHILFAFPNAYYAPLEKHYGLANMPHIQNEVKYAMEPNLMPPEVSSETKPEKFGAKDVFDLNWKMLLDAYSCTECGRCTAACPANITGKKLSPRKIMMATRDRLQDVGKNIAQNKVFVNDNKQLLGDYISVEELRACTTCNACVTECPVSISPLNIIIEMRRALILEDGNAPKEWNSMFANIESNFAPWKLSIDDRDKWIQNVN
ncbi:MAG: (Fe-S)-binding protein [Alphaproteobacteria bacterium]|nr:(Fe-S)-binding protein [Alphaproteobacteria bacterium]